jgi:hypothetical protein
VAATSADANPNPELSEALVEHGVATCAATVARRMSMRVQSAHEETSISNDVSLSRGTSHALTPSALETIPKAPGMANRTEDSSSQMSDLTSREQRIRHALTLTANQPWDIQSKGPAIAENDPMVKTLDIAYAGKRNPQEPRCTPETIAIIYTLLRTNHFVRSLFLTGNPEAMTPKAAPLLAKIALRVETLDLSECNITDGDIINGIIQSLAHPHSRLQTLLLDKNRISPAAVNTIVKVLRTLNVKLTKLSMNGNALQIPKASLDFIQYFTEVNRYAPAFAQAVRRIEANDPTYTFADISYAACANSTSPLQHPFGELHSAELPMLEKPVDDDAVKLLCIACSSNTYLQKLILSDNNISDRGAKFLSHTMRTSSSLQWIDLSSNKIAEQGALMLLAAVQENGHIEELRIGGNDGVTLQTKRILAAQLQRNRMSTGN